MAEKVIGIDIDGYDIITDAIKDLLNEYPKLKKDQNITFGNLGDTSGITMVPTSGSLIYAEKDDVTGKTTQECAYQFLVIYRGTGLSEKRKINIKEWLDDLGKWLGKEKIKDGIQEYKLKQYPMLEGGRTFKSIKSMSQSYPSAENESGTEDWEILIQALYINEFYKEE